MRKLKTSDIPAFCRCLKNIGIKEEVKKIAQEANTAQDAWSKGFDLLWNIFDLATEKKGEAHLYEFLSGIYETSPQELEDMPLDEFMDGMRKISAENNLLGFFSSAARSMR